jgi:homospermidine synthase
MQRLGVKGIHVAERDTQISAKAKPVGVFVNTWSVDGLLSEGYQPAELGWGTHEKKLPPNGHAFDHGPGYAIWIDRPGADTRVRSWCPGVGPQFGYVITHNEALVDPRLLHRLGRGPRGLPPDVSLCLPPLQRRDPFAA